MSCVLAKRWLESSGWPSWLLAAIVIGEWQISCAARSARGGATGVLLRSAPAMERDGQVFPPRAMGSAMRSRLASMKRPLIGLRLSGSALVVLVGT